ncbi:Ribosomal protein L22, partial [Operophtera brumata]
MNSLFRVITNGLKQQHSLHTCSANLAWSKPNQPKSFLEYNRKVYPPQEIDEEPRPAFVCHQKTNFKYSPEKLWYIASFVRGMTADEAVKQLSFVHKKGAGFVKEAILEAQELAVKEHNFVCHQKTNFKYSPEKLWYIASFVRGMTADEAVKQLSFVHKKGAGFVKEAILEAQELAYCHYFVRLEEGKPPKDYYKRDPLAPEEQLD